jgi:hypothetical protein
VRGAIRQLLFSGPGGSSAVPTLESCVQDGTIRLLYDAASGYVPEVGAVAANWTPRIGGTAADVLAGVLGNQPVYSASDVGFGGRPSVTGNGVKGMVSATPGSAFTVSQPGYLIVIGRNHTPVAGNVEYIADGAGSSNRWILDKLPAQLQYNVNAGAQGATGSDIVAEELNLITVYCNTTSSSFRKRNSAGAVYASGARNFGTGSAQGLALFANYAHSFPTTFGVTAVMIVTGLSAADQERLDAWCQVAMGWT